MLSFFNSKKNMKKAGLLQGMTDVHSHLLPGVDDGVSSLEEALQILKYLQEAGVSRMYLTPHIMADLNEKGASELTSRFKQFVRACPDWIELRLAGEYMLDAGFAVQCKAGLLTMARRHVLVETSYWAAPPNLLNILYELSVDGYVPILAHPERYGYMTEEDYRRLKENGYKFQLNLMSLAGVYGKQAAHRACRLLEKGFYDFAGSDIHRLDVYRQTVEEYLLTRMQQNNLKKLLENNHFLW